MNTETRKLAFEVAELRRRIATHELNALMPPANCSEKRLYVDTHLRNASDLSEMLAAKEASLRASIAALDEQARVDRSQLTLGL